MASKIIKFKWFITGALFGWVVLPLVAYAAVSVPNSGGKGYYLSGLATGNYQTNAPCSNGLVLIASSTTSSGWACGSTSGSSGITSINNATGPSISISTGTAGTIFNLASTTNAFVFNLPIASSVNTGQLSSTDWSTFNNKQATISVTAPITLTGASVGIVNQGTSAQVLHGNPSGNASFGQIVNADITNGTIDLTAKVTGILPVVNGGTGAANLTTNDILFGNGTSPVATSSNFTFNPVSNTETVTGTTTVSNGIIIGATSFASPFVSGQTKLAIQGNVNNYLETNIQNTNNGATASSDFTATANNGTGSTYFANFGINSSGFTNIGGISGGPDDAYLFNSDNSLYLGTSSTTNTSSNVYVAVQNTQVATGTKTGFTFSNASTTQLFITGIATGNCLQTSTNGLVTGTGSACGSGGSGNTTWLFGNGTLYNGSTNASNTDDSVLIGTTTPTTSKLFVQGTSTKSTYFTAASSSGATVLNVQNALFPQVNIGTTTNQNIASLYVRGTSATTTAPLLVVASSTGTSLFIVTAAGRVGIGAATPATGLDVGTSQISGGTNVGSSRPKLDLSGESAFPSANFIYPAGGVFKAAEVSVAGTNDIFFQGVPATTAGYTYLESWTSAGLILGTGNNGATPIIFKPNRTEIARLTTTGLGVGTTTSSTRVAITGTPTIDPLDISSTSGASIMRVTQDGNVGIGTTTPTKAFVIATSTGEVFSVNTSPVGLVNISGVGTNVAYRINGATTGMGLSGSNLAFYNGGVAVSTFTGSTQVTFTGNVRGPSGTAAAPAIQVGSSAAGIYNLSSGLEFTTNSTNIMNISSGGLVGIGTTTGTSILTVQGTSTLPTTVLLTIASSTGASFLQVGSNGRVGIASSTPNYGFVNNGTAALTGLTTSAATFAGFLCASSVGEVINDSGTSCVVSAKRFKTHFDAGDYGLNLFLNLPARSYYYKSDYLGENINNINANGKQEGVFADDVAVLAPELATYQNSTSTYDGAAPGSVEGLQDFSHWLGPIAKSFQDLQIEINNIQVGKVISSAEDKWQDLAIALLICYVIYNERDKRRKKV